MDDSDQQRVYIESARREYGDNYDILKWISPEEAAAAAEEREKLLLWLQDNGAAVYCGGTKPVCKGMSPGCRSCTAGEWSCLFINGLCNGRCFFCPADQTEMGEPTTQTLQFTDPKDYVDYIEKFGFKGISMSGGEPLLSFDRTISFISAIKEKFGRDVHLWLYTNGKLVTRDKLKELKKAGADEIRFNIYAHDGFLKKIRMAADLIENVTVEVPAIPEEFDGMKKTMEDFRQSGVQFLNLHQLRLTPHNFPHLSKRGYTFLHGPRVTVMESELTALKLMKYNLESGIGLAINYCSFPYKNRYQKAAERRRHALCIMKPIEDLTEAGMIRSMCIKGPQEQVQKQAKILKENNIGNAWELSSGGDCLHFSQACWPQIDFRGLSLSVRYHDTAIRSSVSYRNVFREIRLNVKQKIIIERWPACAEIKLNREDIALFGIRYMGTVGIERTWNGNGKATLRDHMEQFEHIQRDLSDYC